MGLQVQSTTKKICKYCISEGQKEFKEYPETIFYNTNRFTVLVQDESIFLGRLLTEERKI